MRLFGRVVGRPGRSRGICVPSCSGPVRAAWRSSVVGGPGRFCASFPRTTTTPLRTVSSSLPFSLPETARSVVEDEKEPTGEDCIEVALETELHMAITAAGYLRRRYSKLRNIKGAKPGAHRRGGPVTNGIDCDGATGATLTQLCEILAHSRTKHGAQLEDVIKDMLDRYKIAKTMRDPKGEEVHLLLHDFQVELLKRTTDLRSRHSSLSKQVLEVRIDEMVIDFIVPLLKGVWGTEEAREDGRRDTTRSRSGSKTVLEDKEVPLRATRNASHSVPMSCLLGWMQWDRMIPIGQDAFRYSVERVVNRDVVIEERRSALVHTSKRLRCFYFDADVDVVQFVNRELKEEEEEEEQRNSSLLPRHASPIPKRVPPVLDSRSSVSESTTNDSSTTTGLDADPFSAPTNRFSTLSKLPQVVTFEQVLADVLQGKQMTTIAAFANFVIRTIFFEVLPCVQQVRGGPRPNHSSLASSGLHIGRLAKRLRWQAETTEELLRFTLSEANLAGATMPPPPHAISPSIRLGSLRSFLEFFDGIFVELSHFEADRRRDEDVADSKGEELTDGAAAVEEEGDGEESVQNAPSRSRGASFENRRPPGPLPPPLLPLPQTNTRSACVVSLAFESVRDLQANVSVFRGHVGPYLLYSRVVRRLFPADVPVPLGVLAQSLLWAQLFAPRFGELLPLLKRVGRNCGNGQLLPVSPSSSSKESQAKAPDERDEQVACLKNVQSVWSDGVILRQIRCMQSDCDPFPLEGGLSDGLSNHLERAELCIALAERFPFHLQSSPGGSRDENLSVLRVRHPKDVTADQKSHLIAFVQTYVLPLLRQSYAFRADDYTEKETSVQSHSAIIFAQPLSYLETCLRWDELDHHPAVRAMGVQQACKRVSLLGILIAYEDLQSGALSSSTTAPARVQVHLVSKSSKEEVAWNHLKHGSSQESHSSSADANVEPYISYGSNASHTVDVERPAGEPVWVDTLNAEDGVLAANGLEGVVQEMPSANAQEGPQSSGLDWQISLLPNNHIVSLMELSAEAMELQQALQPFYAIKIPPHTVTIQRAAAQTLGCIPMMHCVSLETQSSSSSSSSVRPLSDNVSDEGNSWPAFSFTDLLVHPLNPDTSERFE